MQLVDAQQARRVLDRLVGYKISPLLWKKVRRGLSAGRVQSVALRIIVDREREIEKFVPVEYWTIEAELSRKLATEVITFHAMLIGLTDGTKLDIHNQEEATEISDELKPASYSVTKVKTKKVTRQPAPPFITSTRKSNPERFFSTMTGSRYFCADTKAAASPWASEIRAVIQKHDGSLLSVGNPTSTLEELFLDIVRDSEARPGRRAQEKQ